MSRASETLVKLNESLELDNKRCETESRERCAKLKESVAKGEAAGFSNSKENTRETLAGDKDVPNAAQLMN